MCTGAAHLHSLSENKMAEWTHLLTSLPHAVLVFTFYLQIQCSDFSCRCQCGRCTEWVSYSWISFTHPPPKASVTTLDAITLLKYVNLSTEGHFSVTMKLSYVREQLVSVAAYGLMVLDRSNTRLVGSNPARGMDVCLRCTVLRSRM